MSVLGCMLSAKYVEAVLSFSVSVFCSGRFDVSAQNTRVCVHVALDVCICIWWNEKLVSCLFRVHALWLDLQPLAVSS